MALYKVTYQHSETIYCTNLAEATDQASVNAYYTSKGRQVIAIEEATESDRSEAERKGMPFITVNHDELIATVNDDEETTYTTDEAIEKITEYFNDNEDNFYEVIEDLDNYNGYLGDDRYYTMDMLNEFYSSTEPTEILYRAFYGHDDDSYYTDNYGDKHYDAFNPNREYFYFNGYGNLVSSDYKDYSDKLDDWFIKAVIDNCGHLNIPDEVQDIINNIDD